MNISSIKIKEIVTKAYITPSKMPGYEYVINPYVGCPHGCLYCYAEFMKRFSHQGEIWGTFTDVKIRSTATKAINLQNKNIFLSSITDCYNPLEEKYGLTRKLLEQLRHSGAHIGILTKSALILRDLDILKTLPDVSVGFSMNTTRDEIRQEIEPYASCVSQRLHALKTLHENGIYTYVHVSPIFPGLSDWKELLKLIMPHVEHISFENLKLRAAAYSRIMNYIARRHAPLLPLYQQIYQDKNMTYWRNLRQEIVAFCEVHKLRADVYFKEKEE